MTVVVLMSERLAARLLTPAALGSLPPPGATLVDADPADLAATLRGARAVITGWDTPPLTDDVLDACPDLGLVAHSGGSIRALVPASVFDRGIRVTQVAAVLAEGVAEFTVMQILAGLRDAYGFVASMRAGEPWAELAARPPGRLLRDQVVGVVGASRVGRATLARLRPFGCRLLVHDPYLDAAGARELGAELTDLAGLLRSCDVVSLHAPLLPATRGMLGVDQLALLRDGALLVNTARAGLVDDDALIAEVRSGRITALLDVFAEEPLPVESPWRGLPGAVPTPHLAALTRETLHEQGDAAVAEVRRFLAGEPLCHEVTRDAYGVIA
ncbi:hydroxyacid dehydrogenase [Micromonospora echinospora]|uniref:hydroxyacid dehydrogenase n=1 Tax=Micromonospora echinospora TaxID=1877 RepID=UPI003797B7D8